MSMKVTCITYVISHKIEKTHLKFLKFILEVHSKSSNAIVRGELGKFPLLINGVKLMIKMYHL